MSIILNFDIMRQPDNTTCGPTCLHAVYRYFNDPISLQQVISEVPRLEAGGTFAVYMACHALRRGYKATILPYNLHFFDPTWAGATSKELMAKLRQQLSFKKHIPGFELVTNAFIEYLKLGGRIRFKVITASLIRKYLKRAVPILTDLSSTYLYNCAREYEADGKLIYDDVRGESATHFVVLAGYNKDDRSVLVADPLIHPFTTSQYYPVNIYHLLCAIMLGTLTYDGNLLLIQERKRKKTIMAQDGDI